MLSPISLGDVYCSLAHASRHQTVFTKQNFIPMKSKKTSQSRMHDYA